MWSNRRQLIVSLVSVAMIVVATACGSAFAEDMQWPQNAYRKATDDLPELQKLAANYSLSSAQVRLAVLDYLTRSKTPGFAPPLSENIEDGDMLSVRPYLKAADSWQDMCGYLLAILQKTDTWLKSGDVNLRRRGFNITRIAYDEIIVPTYATQPDDDHSAPFLAHLIGRGWLLDNLELGEVYHNPLIVDVPYDVASSIATFSTLLGKQHYAFAASLWNNQVIHWSTLNNQREAAYYKSASLFYRMGYLDKARLALSHIPSSSQIKGGRDGLLRLIVKEEKKK